MNTSKTQSMMEQKYIKCILEILKRGKPISFCAPSGTGKTTFLCHVIQMLLSQENHISTRDIFVLKMSHHEIDLDKQGTDSQKYHDLGIDVFATNSVEDARLCLEQQKQQQKICLVEGGRRLELPCIVLSRKGFDDPKWQPPQKKYILYQLQL